MALQHLYAAGHFVCHFCMNEPETIPLISQASCGDTWRNSCQQEGQKALRALAGKKSSILSRIDTSSFQSSTKVRLWFCVGPFSGSCGCSALCHRLVCCQ
jgi:hypothetical protein